MTGVTVMMENHERGNPFTGMSFSITRFIIFALTKGFLP
jgi:hypothetical protein